MQFVSLQKKLIRQQNKQNTCHASMIIVCAHIYHYETGNLKYLALCISIIGFLWWFWFRQEMLADIRVLSLLAQVDHQMHVK